jgi:ribosomal protein S18 acetylase RimI-like enzyme
MNGVQKLSVVVAREGLSGLARAIRDYGRAREYSVYRRDIRGLERDASRIGGIRAGSLSELWRWRSERGPVATPFLADRTSGWSDFCWAWSEGQPIGVVWMTTKSPLLLTDEGEAVIVDLYTMPAFRGRGIATALVAAACQELKEGGVRTVYATVELNNMPSRRAFERSGFTRIAEFTCRGWLGRRHRTARWAGVGGT